MLVCSAVIVGGVYLYLHVDDEIRRHVEKLLADQYTGLEVTIAGARLLPERGVEIRNLHISEPESETPLLEIDEIFLAAKISMQDLASGPPPADKIVVRRPTLYATRRINGHWNIERLLPLPKLGDSSPLTIIEEATLVLADTTSPSSTPLTLHDGHFTIEPVPPEPLDGTASARRIVKGRFSGRAFRSIEFQGMVDPATGQLTMTGSLRDLSISAELLTALPITLPEQLKQLESLRGQFDAQFSVAYDATVRRLTTFEINGSLQQGTLKDARLPHPLNDIAATFRCTDQNITVNVTHARCGESTASLEFHRASLATDNPTTISLSANKIRLNRDLFANLPGKLPELWKKFQPTGEISLAATLRNAGGQWQTDANVTAHGVNFVFEKFPYPAQGATGTIRHQDDHLSVDLTAYAGDRPVRIRCEIDNPGPTALGWVEVQGNDLMIDDHVIEAIRNPQAPKPYEIVRSLHPQGRLNLYWKGLRTSADQMKMRQHLVLDVISGALRFDRFPYPLSGVHGRIEVVDGNWMLQQLIGANDTGVVTCDGTIQPASAGGEIKLTFTGTNVPLEEELRQALPNKTRQLWDHLQPRGRVNLPEVTVQYAPGKGPASFLVKIEPVAETTSIKPASFPVRMEKLRGVATYQDGHVTLDNLRAQYGSSPITATGSCDCSVDGRWQLDFRQLTVDRLRTDRHLLLAFPDGLRRVVTQLNPNGAFNLTGTLTLVGDANPSTPTTAAWNVALTTHETDLDCGIQLDNVRGSVQLAGQFDGRGVHCNGELDVDSAIFLNNQFTKLTGPFIIYSDRVALGNRATRQTGQPDRSIAGQLYGGQFTLDGNVKLANSPQYDFRTTLRSGKLRQFAQETLPGQQKLRGNVDAEFDLHGQGRLIDGLRGIGQIRLRNAHVYELPPVVALLNVLQARAPDATAFVGAEMRVRIAGPLLVFDQLDLKGNAVSLTGSGEVDFNWRTNLTFSSLIGRGNLNMPLVRRVLGQTSGQIMKIHVTGDLRNPQVTPELLPMLNDTIKQLQSETPVDNPWMSRLPDPRRMFSP